MRRLTRPDLDRLPKYVPGRTVPGSIKLASNEVPFGPLPGVVEAIAGAAGQTHRYPDLAAVALRDMLAERYGVDPDRVATGCGSVAMAEHIARVTCMPGDEMLYSWRSFEAYPIIASTTGATSVAVPNDAGHGHDLEAMAAAVTDRTRLILVCNPNNPTGTSSRKADLDAFLDAVPDDVLVVLDEAYREFVTDPDVPDAITTYADRPNIVVLRTLSKAWGLAGLRIGFTVASPDVTAAIRKAITPFSTNTLAQVAAVAALGQAEEMRRRADIVISERERVLRAARQFVPDIPTSQANFIWLPLGERTTAFAAACEVERVIVRPFHPDGVRVTIGTPDENDAFLAAMAKALDR